MASFAASAPCVPEHLIRLLQRTHSAQSENFHHLAWDVSSMPATSVKACTIILLVIPESRARSWRPGFRVCQRPESAQIRGANSALSRACRAACGLLRNLCSCTLRLLWLTLPLHLSSRSCNFLRGIRPPPRSMQEHPGNLEEQLPTSFLVA